MGEQPDKKAILVTTSRIIVASHRPGAQGIWTSLLSTDLRPLRHPRVAPDFRALGALHRTAEAIRYFIAVCEYRLAPNGWIRSWMALTARVAIFLALPFLALYALLSFVVPVFAGVAEIFHYVEATARSAFLAVVYLIAVCLALCALFALVPLVVKVFTWMRQELKRTKARESDDEADSRGPRTS